jgi:putative phosphoesterase
MATAMTGDPSSDEAPDLSVGSASDIAIGLIADTHGWLDPAIHDHFAGVARIVHAGDVGDPEVLRELARIAPVTAVRGNIDWGPLQDLPLTAVIAVAGVRIASLHIAGSPLRPNAAARDLIARTRPDVLLVGHSHIPVAGRVLGTLWINPGAAGHHGFHERRTAALLRVAADGERRLYEIDLGRRGRGGAAARSAAAGG